MTLIALCSSIEVTGFFVVLRLRWINNDNNYGFDFGLVKCLTKEPLMAYISKQKEFISLWFVFKLSTQTTQNKNEKKKHHNKKKRTMDHVTRRPAKKIHKFLCWILLKKNNIIFHFCYWIMFHFPSLMVFWYKNWSE